MNDFNNKKRDLGPRKNENIRIPNIQVIDQNGTNIGIVATREAMDLAADANLDLVEINPNAKPPICKIMDYGKWKYEQKKRESENKKKQKVVELKEIKFRCNIETHDYMVKMKNLEKFISKGDKVKVSLRFRGREIANKEMASELINRVIEDSKDYAKVETKAKMEGRQMVMILIPA